LGENIFYRLDRILNWSNGSGYQLENSLIAIASSGIYGFGINHVPIYFPEASTDFIFTTFASSLGFIGCILLFIIIILFDTSIISLLQKKLMKSDQYILVGLFAMTIYQQVQNISMTIGLLPITGITLPLISYGGSSLISYMFICGIILKISNENKKFLN
jgi:rod shape determining protein RodA